MSHASERSGVLRRGLITTAISRGVAAAVPLMMVPIALNHLGLRDYGAWQAAIALTAVVAFADLGIGTGVMTKLGKAQHTQDTMGAQRIITSGYVMIGSVASVLLAALIASTFVISWSEILGATAENQSDSLDFIVVLTLASVIVNMLTSLIVRIQYGVNQQARSNLWQTAGSFCGLFAAYAVTRLGDSPLWFVVAAMFVPPLIAMTNTATFFLFNSTGRRIRPRVSAIHRPTANALLLLGFKFFLVSLLMTMAISLDPWIVARITTLETVPTFSVAARIFATLGTAITLMSVSLWPLHAQALAAGDRNWITRITWKMSVRLTAVLIALSAVAIVAGPTAISLWLDNRIEFDLNLWLALACWWVIQAAVSPFFMVQNGGEVIAPQLVAYAILAAVVIPAKFWLGANYGLAVMVWTGVAAYVLIVVPACALGYRLTLQQLTTETLPATRRLDKQDGNEFES